MAREWKPLEALGPYYGESWFVTRPGEGAFSQVLNRTPEQAAKAKRRPMPPNLETYAAALIRDEIDESTVIEWSPFRIPDIERGDWIDAMIADQDSKTHGERTPPLPLSGLTLPSLHAGPRPRPQEVLRGHLRGP
jgi:hypothetical protein